MGPTTIFAKKITEVAKFHGSDAHLYTHVIRPKRKTTIRGGFLGAELLYASVCMSVCHTFFFTLHSTTYTFYRLHLLNIKSFKS